MSKVGKELMTDDIRRRLEGVDDALLISLSGLNSEKTFLLRKQLREQGVRVLVVKNSLARRATEGTPLHPAFDGLGGATAVVFGGEDIISLAKIVADLDKSDEFAAVSAKGGVMDGEALSAEKVLQISKWPNRAEQLSLLAGQILSVGATLAAQIIGPGGALVSQITSRGEEGGGAWW